MSNVFVSVFAVQAQRRKLRGGYTLVEMLVASASAAVLIAGLGSSIFIVSQAFDASDGAVVQELNTSIVIEDMLADIQLAERFSIQSTTQVEFSVPDRDGDGENETISYTWSGTAGDPLLKAVNGSPPEAVIESVDSLSFDFETRDVAGIEAPSVFVPAVVYEGFEEDKVDYDRTTVSIPAPDGLSAGDLLIAVIAANGNMTSTFKTEHPDWNLLGTDVHNANITLGVWYRIATDNESSNYTLDFGQKVGIYAWLMHFSGNDHASPIENFRITTGRSKSPSTPGSETTVENAMVLRIGAFDDNSVKEDDTGMSDTRVVTMDSVPSASGGAAFSTHTDVGSVKGSQFELTTREDYVTATLVIKPALEAP